MMLAALIATAFSAASSAADRAPLALDARVLLGATAGRIDYFASDSDWQLLSWPNSAMKAWASSI